MNDKKYPIDRVRTDSDDSALGDVEAHGFRGNALPDDEDAEGHAYKSGRALPEDEDTEGHGARWGGLRPEDEDTEGHIARPGRALPDDEGDDTEGHGVRVRF